MAGGRRGAGSEDEVHPAGRRVHEVLGVDVEDVPHGLGGEDGGGRTDAVEPAVVEHGDLVEVGGGQLQVVHGRDHGPAQRPDGLQELDLVVHVEVVGRLVEDEQVGALGDAAREHRPPALIVWGNQDRVADVSGGVVYSKLLPNSELRIMSNIGHLPMIEDPKTSAADYIAFRNALPTAPEPAPVPTPGAEVQADEPAGVSP